MRTAAPLGRQVGGAWLLATVAGATTALLPTLAAALLSGCSGPAALPGHFKWRSATRAATPQPVRPVMPLMQVQARMVYPQAIKTVGAAVSYLLEPHSYRPAYAGAPAVAERMPAGNYAADPVPLFVAMQRLMGQDGRIVVDEDRRLYVLRQRLAGEAAVAFASLAPPSAPAAPLRTQSGAPAPAHHGVADPLPAGDTAPAPPRAQVGAPAPAHHGVADPLPAGDTAPAPLRTQSGAPAPAHHGAADPLPAGDTAPAPLRTGQGGANMRTAPPAHNPAVPVAMPGNVAATGSAPSGGAYFILPDIWNTPHAGQDGANMPKAPEPAHSVASEPQPAVAATMPPAGASPHFLLPDSRSARHHGVNRETSPKKRENTSFSAKIGTKVPAGPPPQATAPPPAYSAANQSQTVAAAPSTAAAPLPAAHNPALPVTAPGAAGALVSAPGMAMAPPPTAPAPQDAASPVKNRSACRSIRFVGKAMLSDIVRSYFLACGFSEVSWRLGAPGRYADYRLSHDLDIPLPGGYEDLVELLHTRFGIKTRVHDHNRIDFHDDEQNLL